MQRQRFLLAAAIGIGILVGYAAASSQWLEPHHVVAATNLAPATPVENAATAPDCCTPPTASAARHAVVAAERPVYLVAQAK